jgi:peptidoglycan/LPS O-acetylase OafA/YrhL
MPSPSSPSRSRAETPETCPAAAARRLDLDVVRGLAILLAMGWHFSRYSSGNAVVDALQWPGGTFGWAGVDLFFVLSGFLVGRLVLREHQRTGRFDSWRFSVRRALKLWPVLYVFLVVYAFAGSEPWQSYFWQSALHVQNYAGTSLAHLWSLAVEEHFYLALALLFPVLARRRMSPKVLVGVLAGLLVTALALRWGGVVFGESAVRIQWRTHFRMDSLAAGVLLAAVSVHWPTAFDRMLRWRWLWAAVSAAGITWLATIGKDGAVGQTLGYTVAYLTAAAFLLLLYRAAWVPRTRWPARAVAAMGRYSYGIYIWHVLAAQLVTGWLPGMDYRTATPAAQLAKYAAAITLGVVATLVVERPMLRLRDRLVPAAARPVTVPPAEVVDDARDRVPVGAAA